MNRNSNRVPAIDKTLSAPVYDRARALDNLENSEELLQEITTIFLADYRSDLDAMQAALATGDAATLFRLVHTLKGSMSTFCASGGFEAAAVLVRLAKEGRLDEAAGQLTLVERLTEELATALRAESA